MCRPVKFQNIFRQNVNNILYYRYNYIFCHMIIEFIKRCQHICFVLLNLKTIINYNHWFSKNITIKTTYPRTYIFLCINLKIYSIFSSQMRSDPMCRKVFHNFVIFKVTYYFTSNCIEKFIVTYANIITPIYLSSSIRRSKVSRVIRSLVVKAQIIYRCKLESNKCGI